MKNLSGLCLLLFGSVLLIQDCQSRAVSIPLHAFDTFIHKAHADGGFVDGCGKAETEEDSTDSWPSKNVKEIEQANCVERPRERIYIELKLPAVASRRLAPTPDVANPPSTRHRNRQQMSFAKQK